ncbi:hypothetical protein [Streptomyces sp. NBC_00239]|uniref:hypothetical protein n=1 Tax=Streptomyces sp. NBC_00239 TaxID=2903640 RepID=UPI002E2D71A6|nr:hypothetical protein [Streptomyces sp. NBC_00239]
MPRHLPASLRTWSGVLLVCALFACLTGLARPAMAMTGPMPMAPPSVAMAQSGTSAVSATSPANGPHCPAAEEQCVAPKGVLVQDGPATQVAAAPAHDAVCAGTPSPLWPHAPPPTAAPPDLHRLCVSRT